MSEPDKTSTPNPSTNGDNGTGKDPKTGKFTKSNKLGKGNPNAKKVANHRQAMMNAVTEEDTIEITKAMILLARQGEPWAVKEFYDRMMGKSVNIVDASVNTTMSNTDLLAKVDSMLNLSMPDPNSIKTEPDKDADGK